MNNVDNELLRQREELIISPEEYEKQVVKWLEGAGKPLLNFKVDHQKTLPEPSGEYTLDGWAEFEVFGGAKIRILIECKRHKEAIKRDVILCAHAKAQEVGAQKIMIFSTSGFQSGAIDFASKKGIALVVFVDGKHTYKTRSTKTPPNYPPTLPKYAGEFIPPFKKGTRIFVISDERPTPLTDWLIKTT